MLERLLQSRPELDHISLWLHSDSYLGSGPYLLTEVGESLALQGWDVLSKHPGLLAVDLGEEGSALALLKTRVGEPDFELSSLLEMSARLEVSQGTARLQGEVESHLKNTLRKPLDEVISEISELLSGMYGTEQIAIVIDSISPEERVPGTPHPDLGLPLWETECLVSREEVFKKDSNEVIKSWDLECKHALHIPLVQGDQAVGSILIGADSPTKNPHLFHRDFLSFLGTRLGSLLQERKFRDDQNSLLHHFLHILTVSHEISGVLNEKQILEIVARRAKELCEADSTTLFLLGTDGETLEPAICLGEYAEESMSIRPKVGEGITGSVALSGKAEIIPAADLDPRSQHIPGTPLTDGEAMLVVPLSFAEKLVGVLSLYKSEGGKFKFLDLDTLSVYATQAAIAIKNAGLYETSQADYRRWITMVNHMHEAAVFLDDRGDVLLLNEAGRRLIESSEDPKGKPIEEVLGDACFSNVLEDLNKVRDIDSGSLSREHLIKDKTFLVSVSSVPQPEGENSMGEVLLFQDVTDFRHIEAHLVESSKMMAVGQLAAGVAHEFNNLIAGIFGYAQLLKINRDPKMIDRAVDVILSSSQRARHLTGSLLTFSRRRSGRREPVDLRSLIRDCVLLLGQQLEQDRIEVEESVPAFPELIADPGQLQQVFLNLLINAQQAQPDGGRITIKGTIETERIVVRIGDNGPGIDPDQVDRVFDPFYTTKGPLGGDKVPGTGLGLTTAYNVLRNHGGNISVAHTSPEGTEFEIALPIRAARTESKAALLNSGSESLAGAGSTPTGALIVEADEASRKQIAKVLYDLGHKSDAPEDPSQAKALLQKTHYKLAFLDELPTQDRGSLYVEMRRQSDTMPIIFITPKNRQEDFPGLDDPWTFLLHKPFRSRDLATLVSRVMTRSLKAAS